MEILKKKRKYKIHWFEYHDPMNWGETEVEGIKNIMQQFSPESKWSYDSDDGWIEVKAVSTFEAKDILEAKEIASGYECGGNDIFTVLDEYNNKLFDEGDI